MAASTRATRRVCLFGLSADPPTGTGGHVGIAQKLASLPDFDEIRILPVYRHTYASKRMRLATYQDRMAMCRLAFEGVAPHTRVSNEEYLSWCRKVQGITSDEEKAKVSVGTAALLEYLQEENDTAQQQKQQQQKCEYSFCLGADAFMDLTAGKWKESERVMQLLQGRFLVLNRVDEMNTRDDDATTNNAVPVELKKRVESVPGAKLISVPSLGAVSSSRVREAVLSHDWGVLEDGTMIHPRVLDYIREKELYTSA